MAAEGDTIVAVSSPPGCGLRAVIRLSGPRAVEIGGGVAGGVLFRAPRSATREDVVEIHLPSAPPLVESTVRSLVQRGARPARPGEFTLRAFLNGRLDLSQAEAVGRLIAAESQEERRAACEQMEGAFSRRIRSIELTLLELCADVEAAIDFADQDIEPLRLKEAVARAASARADLLKLRLETAARRVEDERPVVALVGRPNAGKSSLFNALAAADALVSDHPGTTRDVLSAEADVGVPVKLLDTAGLQEAQGVDAQAVRLAGQAAESADLLLFVVDATGWESALPLEPRGRPAVLVVNKCDLTAGEPARRAFRMSEAVCISARTGAGLPELRGKLAGLLSREGGAAGARFLVSLRQRALLGEAEAALGRAEGAAPGLGMEFMALDLRAALDALGAITGRNVGEDLLDHIFSRFCLGK